MSIAGSIALEGNPPRYKLFDDRGVFAAAFLASPGAGGTLMAINYWRLKRPKLAWLTLGLSVAVTGALLALGQVLPRLAATLISLALAVGVRQLAGRVQGSVLNEHIRNGGERASVWAGVGFGLLFLAVMLLIVGVGIYVATEQKSVLIGAHDRVYYSGTASKQEADRLGQSLKDLHYFSDRGVTVFLNRDKDGTIVSFVVKDGTWDQPQMVTTFEAVGKAIAPSVGGLPVRVRLTNKMQDVKKEIEIRDVAATPQ